MSQLTQYQHKRDFERTPEPKGEEKKNNDHLVFVVHKHQASHLHYDLRLELDGVLKSWAVPKGPSLNPDDKRLAMQVEDHPYDYKDFEGIIPEGNYGAGTVMIWDEGIYTVLGGGNSKEEDEKIMEEGLENKQIVFFLSGHKLKGEFALVQLKGRLTGPFQEGRNKNWLLIKAHDAYADQPIKDKDLSARTGRTMEEIAKNNS